MSQTIDDLYAANNLGQITTGDRLEASRAGVSGALVFDTLLATVAAAVVDIAALEAGVTSPLAQTVIRDEFLFGSTESGEMGELGWSFTNGTFNLVNPIADHPGVARRASTAVSGTVASTYPGGGGTTISMTFEQLDEVVFVIRVPTTSADVDLRFGLLGDMTANPPTNGAYVEKLSTDTNWFGVTRVSGSQTREDLGVAAAADTWFKLKVRRISSSSVGFTVDNGSEETIGTTIPVGTNNMTFGFQLTPTTANARNVDIDFFAMRLAAMTR